MYQLQHEQPYCISEYTNSSRRRYNTDANAVNGLKNDSSYDLTGKRILEIDEFYAEKFKVYVNQ